MSKEKKLRKPNVDDALTETLHSLIKNLTKIPVDFFFFSSAKPRHISVSFLMDRKLELQFVSENVMI